ncbi:hypothetical protein BK702_09240 [Bacillus thuringiensis serovar cameroun]|nr:hypothetical protein BK702_09240 [Bacillus thuringiensis serovar cameroun]
MIADGYQNNIFLELFSFKISHVSCPSNYFSSILISLRKLYNRTYKTIKRELIQGAKFKTPEQARKEIFKYIELYYNTKRIHSSLDYLSPVEFEKDYS